MTVVVGFVGLIASLLVLGSIAEGVRAQEVFALDTWATPFLHGIASPGLDTVMQRLTDIGSSLVIVPIFVVVMALTLWKRRYGAALFLGLASGGALILNGAMKVLFERPRPHLAWATVLPDYSFPSGHTMNAFVFYVALALIAWSVFGRRVGLIAVAVLVIAIGLYIAFVLPIILRLRAGESFERGAWHLGRHYKWIDWIAILWIGFISLVFFAPFAYTGIPGNKGFTWYSVNYTIIVVGGSFVLFGGWYVLSARKWFKGPIRQGSDEELARIEAGYEPGKAAPATAS